MSAVRRTTVVAAAGTALAGFAVTAALSGSPAQAAERAAGQVTSAPKDTAKQFVAYGPIRNQQRTSGQVSLAKHEVTGSAFNGTWSNAHSNRNIGLKFTYATTQNGKMQTYHKDFNVTRNATYHFPFQGKLNTMSVQMWQGNRYGAKVNVI
jgi:predicted 3-demethylubiquinone-9 3-methyltransferase (glyoxalase superfamily)